MDDLVSYKVYMFCAEGAKPEVRRFGIEKSVVTSFQYLNAKLQDVFPGLKIKSYSVTWKDEEDDEIMISSDEEMIAALTAITPVSNIIKLFVHCKNKDKKDDDDVEVLITAHADGSNVAVGSNNMVHYGITCDGCDHEVVGFRYKCISCDDYDLCSACEANGLHREHCMLRVPLPTLPRTVIKAAIKRSRHFLKSVVGPVGEDCLKRHRRDRSGDRRHRGNGDGGQFREHRDYHSRRPRTSWLETFATYMNEFANLAGDVPLDLNAEQPKKDAAAQASREASTSTAPQTENAHAQTGNAQAGSAQNEKAQSGNSQAGNAQAENAQTGNAQNENDQVQENPQNSTQANQEQATQATAQNPTTCPFFPANVNVKNIQKLIEMYIHGRLNVEDFLREDDNTTSGDVVMREGTLNAELDNESLTSSESRADIVDEARNRDASPDKVEGWTVISKDKDVEEAAPIGFNLPQEFQERVQISQHQSLYPALNTATAVLNPKEPELSNAPSAPQLSQAPPQPQPKPRQRHPKPHIEAAIQQMLSMGFTNEGDWLTHVVESKDGNISAVLDLLTPAHKM